MNKYTKIKLDIACDNFKQVMKALSYNDDYNDKWNEMGKSSSVKRMLLKQQRDILWDDVSCGIGDILK